MFALRVLYSKEKSETPGQSVQRNTDKVKKKLSKAWICGRSISGIAGLSPAGRMGVCCVFPRRGFCVSLCVI